MEPDPRQPDDVAPHSPAGQGALTPRPARFAALREAPVAAALVCANVVVLALLGWRFADPTSAEALVAGGALERGLIRSGQWWRLLSAVFLHIGWIHLLANSIFGFGWCRMVERVFGHRRFLALYLLAGLGASAASVASHDAIGAGASGALFGMIGATLVIHRRLLPGWRPFLRSPTTLSVGVQLAVWTVLAVAADLPIDHAAHFGGLLTGAAAAWIMTRAFPRRLVAWLPFAAAVGVLVAVAVWPRPGRSAWEMDQLVRSASSAARAALQREDLDGMERELKRLDDAGHHSDEMEYLRAVAAFMRDDLETAAAIGERLLKKKGSAPLQEAAASVLASVGYRYYSGEGIAADAERGYRYIRQACQAGLAEACRAERMIRTGELPVAPAGPGQ